MFTHKFFGAGNSCELLEQHAILGFKNILVCQMIYAMVYDFPFIAFIRTLADLCKWSGSLKLCFERISRL
jgi:hypothetical protein